MTDAYLSNERRTERGAREKVKRRGEELQLYE
jgi:hypothetical protein